MQPHKAKAPEWVYILFIIGIASIAIRFLLDTRFGTTAILYVAIPFIISFLIFQFTPPGQKNSFARHMRTATIVMLGSSAFLFEGFICVLFFYPIYIIIVGLSYAIATSGRASKEKGENNSLKASIVPLIVMVMSVEGVAPSTSFERQNAVTRAFIIDADVATIQANMAAPIILPKKRNWMLSIFPLPIETRAGSLSVGDVHEMDFIYKRWFFTNVKRGKMALRIDSVSNTQITTTLTENTSYLSTYINIKGSEINFMPLPDGRTHVSLTMNYERLLDPAWYFGTLQHYAVSQMCDYFVEAVYARGIDYEEVGPI